MITRDLAETLVIHAFDPQTYDASCGTVQGCQVESTGAYTAGRIIDRLGLGRAYRAVAPVLTADGDIGTSTLDAKYMAIGVRLMHSSTTCAADFDELTSGQRPSVQGLFVIGNTDTCAVTAPSFMATSTALGSTGTQAGRAGLYTATATDGAIGHTPVSVYNLDNASRYLRVEAMPFANASSSGGSILRIRSGVLLFGEPDLVPALTTSTGVEKVLPGEHAVRTTA